MALNQDEQILAEAFETMLNSGDGLGLSRHKSELERLGETESGPAYLHGEVDLMFHQKASELLHYDGACAAFAKVHSYKYIDDPTFEAAMNKELTAQGIPTEEREKALEVVVSIVEELRNDKGVANEQDAGWHPDLDEIADQNADAGVDD